MHHSYVHEYRISHCRPTVELYYMAELAFYGASLLMLLLWEERRHDFIVMMAHHLVTITLIAFSYITK